MKKIIVIFILITNSLLFSSNLKLNSIFPDIPLNGTFLKSYEKKYLGLKENIKQFTIPQIKAKYKIIEFINVYCFACQKQAPEFNKFYNNLKCKPEVKFIGIGLGNSNREIKSFKERFKIDFPIVPDKKFKVYEAIGGTRTPFTLILKDNRIIYGHLGLISDYNELYSVLLDNKSFYKVIAKEKHKPKPVSDNLVIKKIKPKFKKITDIKKYKNYYKVFADGRIFYVVVVSSSSVCNICHPVQFIYIVTQNGKIYDFIPIHITRRFNKEWSQEEVDKIRSRLIGRSILKELTFNKDVDAVTSATITSSMIFYFINQAKKFLPIK